MRIAPLTLVLGALSGAACSGRYAGDPPAVADGGPGEAAAPLTDASPEPDASDGAAPGDAAVPSVCAGTHLFCDDFERGAVGETWEGVDDTEGLLAKEIAPLCARGSRCLRGRIDGDATHESSVFRGLKVPTAGFSVSVTVALDGLVHGGAGGLGFLFVQLPLPSGSRFRHVNTFAASSGISLQAAQGFDDGGGSGQSRVVAPVASGAHRLKLTVVPKMGFIEATATIDGGAPQTVTLDGATPERATVVLGLPYRPGTTGGFVYADDLVVDAL